MSKKKWVLVILIMIGLGYLLISKINPNIGVGIDNIVGPAVGGTVSGIVTAVTNSQIWQTWGYYISFATGSILFLLLGWKGRAIVTKFKGQMGVSAAKDAGFVYQTVPTAQPVAIPQQVAAVVQPQQVIPQPQPQPQEQPKQ